jgi:hypothetical protein
MTTPNDEMPDRVAIVRALRAIGRDPKALAFMTPPELQLAPPTLTDYNSQQHDVTTPGRFLAHTDLVGTVPSTPSSARLKVVTFPE